jgi:serine/threonine protein kinase
MEKLGKGRFGEVFVAREKKSQFVVALKRIARQEIENGNFLEQIKR